MRLLEQQLSVTLLDIMELITASELRKQIQNLVTSDGVSTVAERFGVTIPYIYMLLSGQRHASSAIAKELGYTRVVTPKPEPVFLPIENNSQD